MTRALPGELPITGDIVTSAPDRVKELIYVDHRSDGGYVTACVLRSAG